MRPIIVIVAVFLACISGAMANGRAGSINQSFEAPNWHQGAPAIAWQTGGDIVREAARWVGSGKFTSKPGPWCADAVSVWLERSGHRPLPSRMAASALHYGPRSSGHPGDLAVFIRHGYAYHVGVVASGGNNYYVPIISGNYGHRVRLAYIPRSMLIFIQT